MSLNNDEHSLSRSGSAPQLTISPQLRQAATRLLTAILLLLPCGCVHRRVTINSNPSGALVRIDGKDVGYTPASIDYTWYGTREVQLIKDGYETKTLPVNIESPWYQRFPLDFVSDNFLGTHVRDHRRFDISMSPQQPDVSQAVIERGRSLRSQAVHGM
ncbi:MAG: PEGA domain-containing protein [Fuerstiella sp.]|nr:PEGA domain-containing protein [Fuerstiella sp.]MCP4857557.1 PEGA domain-containing protein [Fuerstiella sp.]